VDYVKPANTNNEVRLRSYRPVVVLPLPEQLSADADKSVPQRSKGGTGEIRQHCCKNPGTSLNKMLP
jgi:hypothetical protein